LPDGQLGGGQGLARLPHVEVTGNDSMSTTSASVGIVPLNTSAESLLAAMSRHRRSEEAADQLILRIQDHIEDSLEAGRGSDVIHLCANRVLRCQATPAL
jgi:hypothetical protein